MQTRRDLAKLFGVGVVSTSPLVSGPVTNAYGLYLDADREIQDLGGQFMRNTGATGLNVDHWVYYWAQVNGRVFTGEEVGSLIKNLGLTTFTRSKEISFSEFKTSVDQLL